MSETKITTSRKPWLTMLLPSLIGILMFMTPIAYEDGITIPVAILAKMIQQQASGFLIEAVVAIVCLSAILSSLATLGNIKALSNGLAGKLFHTTPAWMAIRVLGAILICATYFKLGPEAIHSDVTGYLVLGELLPVLLSVFILAGLMLPLLLNFGLLEFFGTLLTKIMRPVFRLPGRAAIDCFASWLGDGSVGILMTSKQYQGGHYTQREAAIIGTTFSAVSITFSLVVIAQVKLEHMFIPFYLTVALAGIVAAIIVPRLPPLCWKLNQRMPGVSDPHDDEDNLHGRSVFSVGLERALKQAGRQPGAKAAVKEGIENVLDMLLGILPVVMAIGTVALIIAEHTPVFNYLGMPFIPLLELLQIPEAEAASATIVVGFADMFLPAILAVSIESDMTRFVIAALSVTQLIYMSEVGALVLGSKIPVNLLELFVIFILRTLVTLPVIALMAHWIF